MSNNKELDLLIQKIKDYEPNLLKKILDFIFIPCFKNPPKNCKYIRILPEPGTDFIKEDNFKNNKDVISLIIDDSVKHIKSMSFYGCEKLKSITFSKNLISIGACCFENCYNLTDIILPNKLNTLK